MSANFYKTAGEVRWNSSGYGDRADEWTCVRFPISARPDRRKECGDVQETRIPWIRPARAVRAQGRGIGLWLLLLQHVLAVRAFRLLRQHLQRSPQLYSRALPVIG